MSLCCFAFKVWSSELFVEQTSDEFSLQFGSLFLYASNVLLKELSNALVVFVVTTKHLRILVGFSAVKKKKKKN